MTEVLIDHLWQSTLFVLAAAVLTLALRGNGANIRFNIWLAASVKFLIPFPLLVLIGKQMRWETAPTFHATTALSLVMDEVAQPGALIATNLATAPLPSTASHWSGWSLVLAIWALGSLALVCRWIFEWGKFHAIVQASSPIDIEVPIPVHETATALEPGILGIFSPVLLLPAGIAARLTSQQFDTIVAHELCHWRRRDNLTAAIHMLVQALFWFHPLVWWLGGRMIVERERACDEEVIGSGTDREVYAEGILKVCQLYVEPPLLCTAGVSGGTLRKRIEEIMTSQVMVKLNFAKKTLLAVAGTAAIAGPFVLGLAVVPQQIAQAQAPGADSTPLPEVPPGGDTEMKHYKNKEWNFELDIPKRWNSFPPVLTNSPFEVVRFGSYEEGNHLLIVFRAPYDPKQSLKTLSDNVQHTLAEHGFANFVTSETTIGSKQVVTLDFSRVTKNGLTWTCRHYFVVDGTILYTLGFGTDRGDVMFGLYDRMAKTFVAGEAPGES
jgi:beta-lactamase regulating signal transducer with metallopeptidase domain